MVGAGTVQLRAADGALADGFDEGRLTLDVGSEGTIPRPLARVAPGLFRFEVRALPGTGSRAMDVDVRLDGASLGERGSRLSGHRTLPIGADRWIALGSPRAYGGCSFSARSPAGLLPPWVLALLGAATFRRIAKAAKAAKAAKGMRVGAAVLTHFREDEPPRVKFQKILAALAALRSKKSVTGRRPRQHVPVGLERGDVGVEGVVEAQIAGVDADDRDAGEAGEVVEVLSADVERCCGATSTREASEPSGRMRTSAQRKSTGASHSMRSASRAPGGAVRRSIDT